MVEVVILITVVLLGFVLVFTSMNDGVINIENAGIDNVQEEASVENTLSEEEVAAELKQIVVILGVVLISVLILVCIAFLIHYLYEKQKRGPETLDETLQFMIRKKPRHLFTLLEGNSEHHAYQYTINKYQWFLEATLSDIDIKMNRKDKQVLHITYDKTTKSFTRKNLKAHVFADDKTLKKVDKLVAVMLSTDWNERLSFNLVSEAADISKEIPHETVVAEHTIITDPMLELEAYLENIIEDAQTKEVFQSVIKNMHLLQDYHMELDIETKHVIEYSLTNDLNRLLTLYDELNEDQKEIMAEEIRKRLDLMNEKVEQIKAKLDAKKADEIKKALHLFDKRYKA